MIPVVLGPDRERYVVDHHHLALALHEQGEKDVLVSVVADLTMVDKNAFWVVLELMGLSFCTQSFIQPLCPVLLIRRSPSRSCWTTQQSDCKGGHDQDHSRNRDTNYGQSRPNQVADATC